MKKKNSNVNFLKPKLLEGFQGLSFSTSAINPEECG